MARSPDVVVAGLGIMGSAVAAELAHRGAAVIGLDPHAPPHRLGSSHGETRMIRQAYSEDPCYVPLVRRAYDAWRDVEERTGRRLLHETGGILAGAPGSALLDGAEISANLYGLPLERPDPGGAGVSHPYLRLPDEHRLLADPRAGYLRAEACVEAFLSLAREEGAQLRLGESMTGWSEDGSGEGGGVRVSTSLGSIPARALLLATGAWTAGLPAAPALPLRPVRMVQHWFAAPDAGFDPEKLPVFLIEYGTGKILYGFPDVGSGVKAAFHHGGQPVDPRAARRDAAREEVEAVLLTLARYFPGARWKPLRSETCLYTMTPDAHFVVDRHPGSRRVVVMAGFSGHGFKFASALAGVAADLLLDLEPAFDPSPFRIRRFAESGGA
jgi:sarcosine oxidase